MVGECQFSAPRHGQGVVAASAYAQWSPDRLHGVEQLSLGVRVQCVALRISISPVITAVSAE